MNSKEEKRMRDLWRESSGYEASERRIYESEGAEIRKNGIEDLRNEARERE